MNLEALKQKYIELGGDPEGLGEINSEIVMQALVESRELAHELAEKYNPEVFVAELNRPVPEEEKPSLSEALVKLRKLKERETEFGSQEHSYKKNLLINYENEVRRYFGLDPQPLEYTDADLKILLELDGWKLGRNVSEFLSKQDKQKQAEYKDRMENILFLRESEARRTARDERVLKEIASEYEKLSQIPRKIKIIDRIPEINPEYNEWRDNIAMFRRKLETKNKEIQSLLREFPEEETEEKYNFFFKIYNDINNLCEKEGIE